MRKKLLGLKPVLLAWNLSLNSDAAPDCKYSWLSLPRPRLSQITTYLEVKIWSLPKHENLTTGKKYCGKEEKLLLRSSFSSFPQYFQYISKSPITYIFVKCGCSNYFFFNSANLICRGTDILKYFIVSLGFRDNEGRLYMYICSISIRFSSFILCLPRSFVNLLICQTAVWVANSVNPD